MSAKKSTARAPPVAQWRRWLSDYVSKRMQETKTPAMSVALLSGDKVVYSRGFGNKDMQSMMPADGNTLYGVGSVTKSFTALAILQLQGRGLLDVHDRVGKHLPEFGRSSELKETEIHHLLNHTCGLPSLNAAEITLFREFGTDTSFIPLATYEEFVDFVEASSAERVAKPGEKFMYWNEGYTILGRIIEKLSGEGYVEYVRRHILEPLGMVRSGFGSEPSTRDDNAATLYDLTSDGKHKPTLLKADALDVAAGGLVTSPIELCNYLRMMMSGGTFGGKKVAKAELLREAVGPTIDEEQLSEFGKAFYGYGWSLVDDFFGHRLVSHSGDVGISSAYVGFVQDLGIGVAVCSNVGTGPNSQVGNYALACLMGKNPDREMDYVVSQDLSQQLAGEYSDYRNFSSFTVSPWGGGLLKGEFKSNEMTFSIPIMLEKGQLFTYNNFRRYPLSHRRLKDGGMEIVFERHRFLKK